MIGRTQKRIYARTHSALYLFNLFISLQFILNATFFFLKICTMSNLYLSRNLKHINSFSRYLITKFTISFVHKFCNQHECISSQVNPKIPKYTHIQKVLDFFMEYNMMRSCEHLFLFHFHTGSFKTISCDSF